MEATVPRAGVRGKHLFVFFLDLDRVLWLDANEHTFVVLSLSHPGGL